MGQRSAEAEIKELRSRLLELQRAQERAGAPAPETQDMRAALDHAQEAMRYLDNIINSIADPIFVKDAKHRWVTLNDAYCRFMGYPREHLLGKSDTDFFPAYQARVFWEKDQQVLDTGHENVNEEEFTDSAGARHIIVTKKALYLGSMGERFVVGVIRDQTAQKEAEQKIRHLNQQLAEQVQRLDAANKELESFSYSVSHDLRTPLTTIDGFAQLLLEDPAQSPEARTNLQRIQTAASRMAGLIDHFLELSRVTRLELRHEEVDLGAMARGLAVQLQQTDPDRPVQWDIQEPLVVRGDAHLLSVVMQNLLGNAFKFTRGRQPARIQVGSSTTPEGALTVFVRDNGAGFDAAQAHRLFQPFRRLHSANDFEGNGVGLATVQRVVHRHHGRVWAEGAVGQGATFSFTLPR